MRSLVCSLLLSLIFPSMLNAQSNKLYITANGATMTATLVENSSTEALKELIADTPLTIAMHDYGDFEKVGALGHTLPRNDEQISTSAGDLILYLGTSFVIYYDHNEWNFTRLGKIDGNPTRDYLLSVLGTGNVNVTLSLQDNATGISDAETVTSSLKVRLNGRTLEIEQEKSGVDINVFNSDGRAIYKGLSKKIELPEAGVYVVTCGNEKAKVLVN